jgi:hypothetical protein
MAKAVVTVNEFAIAQLVQEDVGRYGNSMGRRIKGVAEGIAPRRSGTLAGSHRYRGFLYRGRYKVGTRVENTADHALFVHEGTTGPILPKRGRYLIVPKTRGVTPLRGAAVMTRNFRGEAVRAKSPWGLHRSVAGQRAQPWLREAGETVAFRAANFSFA